MARQMNVVVQLRTVSASEHRVGHLSYCYPLRFHLRDLKTKRSTVEQIEMNIYIQKLNESDTIELHSKTFFKCHT